MRIGRPLLFTALMGLVSACVIDVDDGEVDDVEAVRTNAALALEQCGVGKVGSVDTDGFTCLGADAE